MDVRFGSKADMCSAQANVRYGPKADMGPSDRNALRLRSKLLELIETDLPFKVGHLGDGLLETVLAKRLVLALLHLFAYGIELMARDYVAELRKQYGILSRRVRSIHCDERLHGVDAMSLRCGITADLRRRFK